MNIQNLLINTAIEMFIPEINIVSSIYDNGLMAQLQPRMEEIAFEHNEPMVLEAYFR